MQLGYDASHYIQHPCWKVTWDLLSLIVEIVKFATNNAEDLSLDINLYHEKGSRTFTQLDIYPIDNYPNPYTRPDINPTTSIYPTGKDVIYISSPSDQLSPFKVFEIFSSVTWGGGGGGGGG